jgi:hypothetical protein
VEADNALAGTFYTGKTCQRNAFASYCVRPRHPRGGPWASSILGALFADFMLLSPSTCGVEEVGEPAITSGAGNPRRESSRLLSTRSARCANPKGAEGSAGVCTCRVGIRSRRRMVDVESPYSIDRHQKTQIRSQARLQNHIEPTTGRRGYNKQNYIFILSIMKYVKHIYR